MYIGYTKRIFSYSNKYRTTGLACKVTNKRVAADCKVHSMKRMYPVSLVILSISWNKSSQRLVKSWREMSHFLLIASNKGSVSCTDIAGFLFSFHRPQKLARVSLLKIIGWLLNKHQPTNYSKATKSIWDPQQQLEKIRAFWELFLLSILEIITTSAFQNLHSICVCVWVCMCMCLWVCDITFLASLYLNETWSLTLRVKSAKKNDRLRYSVS